MEETIIDELRPAFHKQFIKEGKMTPEESSRIIERWIIEYGTPAQLARRAREKHQESSLKVK